MLLITSGRISSKGTGSDICESIRDACWDLNQTYYVALSLSGPETAASGKKYVVTEENCFTAGIIECIWAARLFPICS